MPHSQMEAHNGLGDDSLQQGSMHGTTMQADAKDWNTLKVGGLTSFTSQNPNSTKETHQYFLSSRMPDGRSSMAYGVADQDAEKVHVIDLDLHNIPSQIDEQSLKKMTGARHIVKTELGQNSLKGTLTGDGRVSIRLPQGQDYGDVKSQLQKAGISASLHKAEPGRNSDFTQNALD